MPRSSTMEYTFTLKYQLADDERDADALVERLGEAGCDDALVGIGQPGRLALEFTREAGSADEAVRSALADVRRAVPSASLIEVAPDLVGLTDVADIVGVSRQNMRKTCAGAGRTPGDAAPAPHNQAAKPHRFWPPLSRERTRHPRGSRECRGNGCRSAGQALWPAQTERPSELWHPHACAPSVGLHEAAF